MRFTKYLSIVGMPMFSSELKFAFWLDRTSSPVQGSAVAKGFKLGSNY